MANNGRKTQKIVLYNILFGMRGNSLLNAVLSNLSMHGIRPAFSFGLLPAWLRKITVPLRSKHLTSALDMIEKHDPDILCLNEVLIERHKEELEKRLEASGFTTIVYGACLHHSPPFKISLVLATKARGEAINFNITMAPQPGGGGGAASIYVPEQNLAILGVHIAFTGSVLKQEMEEVNEWINTQKGLGRKTLVIGDFNLEKAQLDTMIPALIPFRETASPTAPSFQSKLINFLPLANTPLPIKKASMCLDHIFYDINFLETDYGTEQGLSDHKLVWSQAEIL